ncbi:hypothetical protein [Jiulongibacter sediminis]|uniref:hypothetical protein n=1 Tax=Jiulongibacter sediminis TaxID=1605367 RepID=UPI0026EE3FA0|nr:hypothetical protein [Jiulongibacter sediminis]
MNFDKKINLDYTDGSEIWLSRDKSLKLLIGVLGMMLPLILAFLQWAYTKEFKILESISHYYYTRYSSILVLVVGLLGFTLLVNKGEREAEFWLSSVSGISAILLLLFPTDSLQSVCNDISASEFVTVLPKDEPREFFHYFVSGLFLLGLSFISIFIFPQRSFSSPQRQKSKFELLYRILGIFMLLPIIFIILFNGKDFYTANNLTFWMEVVAIELFGVSWIIKAVERDYND